MGNKSKFPGLCPDLYDRLGLTSITVSVDFDEPAHGCVTVIPPITNPEALGYPSAGGTCTTSQQSSAGGLTTTLNKGSCRGVSAPGGNGGDVSKFYSCNGCCDLCDLFEVGNGIAYYEGNPVGALMGDLSWSSSATGNDGTYPLDILCVPNYRESGSAKLRLYALLIYFQPNPDDTTKCQFMVGASFAITDGTGGVSGHGGYGFPGVLTAGAESDWYDFDPETGDGVQGTYALDTSYTVAGSTSFPPGSPEQITTCNGYTVTMQVTIDIA